MKNIKYLFITGHRKSGTTFFCSLLDNHPSLCVYPFDLTILYAYYPQYIKKNIALKKKKKYLISLILRSWNIRERQIKNKSILKKKKFKNILEKKISLKSLNNIFSIINTVSKSFLEIYPNKNFKYFVFKETSISMYFNEFSENFKKCKFIQIIRDPRENLLSLLSGKKYYKKLGEDKNKILDSLIFRSAIDLSFGINNEIKKPKNYKTLRYEDLTQRTKKSMFRICRFLNIKFDKKLLFPTVLGQNFLGNSFRKKKITKIINQKTKWKKHLSNYEISVIEFFLKNYIEKLNYKLYNNNNINKHLVEFYKWKNYEYYFNFNLKYEPNKI